MNEGQARMQAQAALEWHAVRVEKDYAVLQRGGPTPTQRLLKRLETLVWEARQEAAQERLAYELLERNEETIHTLENTGWTVNEIVVEPDTLIGISSSVNRILTIRASTMVEGEDIRYTVFPTGEEWQHIFEGLGVEFGVDRREPAGVLASPEVALRLLRDTIEFAREWGRSYVESEVYRYLLAQCAPGEEPDPEQFERLTEACCFGGESGYDVGEVIDPEPMPASPCTCGVSRNYGEFFVIKRGQGIDG